MPDVQIRDYSWFTQNQGVLVLSQITASYLQHLMAEEMWRVQRGAARTTRYIGGKKRHLKNLEKKRFVYSKGKKASEMHDNRFHILRRQLQRWRWDPLCLVWVEQDGKGKKSAAKRFRLVPPTLPSPFYMKKHCNRLPMRQQTFHDLMFARTGQPSTYQE